MNDAKRVGFSLSAVVSVIFFGMVLVMAFRPQLLTGSRGLIGSLAFILFTLVVMGAYSWWRIAHIDD